MQEVIAVKERVSLCLGSLPASCRKMGTGVKGLFDAEWVWLSQGERGGLCRGRARIETINDQMSWKGWRDHSWKDVGLDGGAGAERTWGRAKWEAAITAKRAEWRNLFLRCLKSSHWLTQYPSKSSLWVGTAIEKIKVCKQPVLKEFSSAVKSSASDL